VVSRYSHGPANPDHWFGRPFIKAIFNALGLVREDFVTFDRPTLIPRLIVPLASLREQHSVHAVFGELCARIGRNLLGAEHSLRDARPVYLSKAALTSGVGRIVNEIASIETQWKQCSFSEEAWDAFVKSIALSSFWRGRANYINFAQIGAHYCNMFIMKAGLFGEYMQFWSEVMFNVQAAVDRSSRYLGYLSERLFSLWVLQKQIENPLLRVADLPYLFCPDEGLADALAAAGLAP
jgi:Domain of unknown function (DUF4422)